MRRILEPIAWLRVILSVATFSAVLTSPQGSAQKVAVIQFIGCLLYSLATLILPRIPPLIKVAEGRTLPILDLLIVASLWQSEVTHWHATAWSVFVLLVQVVDPKRWMILLSSVVAIVSLLIHQGSVGSIWSWVTYERLLPIMVAAAIGAIYGLNRAYRLEQQEAMDQLARGLGFSENIEQACGVGAEAIRELTGADYVALAIKDHEPLSFGSFGRGGQTLALEVRLGKEFLGHCEVWREAPLSTVETRMIGRVLDRLSAAVLRWMLIEELLTKARLEEKLKFADDLHDSYLQSMAAADLHVEALRIIAERHAVMLPEVETIRHILRSGASQAREFIDDQAAFAEINASSLRDVVAKRWEGEKSVSVPDDLHLSKAAWRALDQLVREGINNAKRHSNPTKITLRITETNGLVTAKLTNDGAHTNNLVFGYGLNRLDTVIRNAGGLMFVESPAKGEICISAIFSAPGA